MSQLPIGLRPVMGYSLWHLMRGETPAQVASRLERDPRYAALSEAQRRAALNEAQINQVVTAQAQVLTGTAQIGSAYQVRSIEGIPLAVPADMVFGARVLMIVDVPGGGTRAHSIVINAPASTDVASIIARAIESVESGAQSLLTGHASPGVTVASAALAQVVIGGYDNAAVTM